MIATLDSTSIPMPMRDSLGETCLRAALRQTGCYESDGRAFLDDANSP